MSNNLEQNNEVVVTQDPDDLSSNPTKNTPFESVLNTYVSRRKVVAGTLAGSTAAFLAPAAHADWGYGFGKHKRNRNQELVGFKPVAISDVTDTTQLTISDDYEYQVLIPWGTPLEPGACCTSSGLSFAICGFRQGNASSDWLYSVCKTFPENSGEH